MCGAPQVRCQRRGFEAAAREHLCRAFGQSVTKSSKVAMPRPKPPSARRLDVEPPMLPRMVNGLQGSRFGLGSASAAARPGTSDFGLPQIPGCLEETLRFDRPFASPEFLRSVPQLILLDQFKGAGHADIVYRSEMTALEPADGDPVAKWRLRCRAAEAP